MPGQISVGDRIRITAAVTSFSVHYSNAASAWRRMVEAGDTALALTVFFTCGPTWMGSSHCEPAEVLCAKGRTRV
jgi:hypothetical protein